MSSLNEWDHFFRVFQVVVQVGLSNIEVFNCVLNAFVLRNSLEFKSFLVQLFGSDLKRSKIGSFFVIFGPHFVCFIKICFFKVQTEFVPLSVKHFLVLSILNLRFTFKLLQLLDSNLLLTLKLLKSISHYLLGLNPIKLLVGHGSGVPFWWSLSYFIQFLAYRVFLCVFSHLFI